VVIAFSASKESEKYFRAIKVNEPMEVPIPLTKEEQEKDKKAVEQYNEDVKKAREQATKSGKKVQMPPRPTPTKPKTHPPEVTVGDKKRYVTDFVYLIVPLSEAEGKSVPTVAKTANSSELSENVRLAAEYEANPFPVLVFSDQYGNELGRRPLTNIKQTAAIIEKAREEMMKEQMRLEISLETQLKEIEKIFEQEKEKGKSTPATIAKLKKIADYKGTNSSYEPVMKARSYLKEAEALASSN
jgi:thioredoxin-related protein